MSDTVRSANAEWLMAQPREMRSLSRFLIEAKKRARLKGVEFNLTLADLSDAYMQAGMRCALTSCRFSGEKGDGIHKAPFAPSIDRIDSKKGYTRDNIRFVCVAVNYALGEWGEEVFATIAKGYVKAADVKRMQEWRRRHS